VPDVRVHYPAKLVPRFMKYRKPVTHYDIEYLFDDFLSYSLLLLGTVC